MLPACDAAAAVGWRQTRPDHAKPRHTLRSRALLLTRTVFCTLQVGDAGLAQLAHQRGLVTLLLDKCSITDAGTAHLTGMAQSRFPNTCQASSGICADGSCQCYHVDAE